MATGKAYEEFIEKIEKHKKEEEMAKQRKKLEKQLKKAEKEKDALKKKFDKHVRRRAVSPNSDWLCSFNIYITEFEVSIKVLLLLLHFVALFSIKHIVRIKKTYESNLFNLTNARSLDPLCAKFGTHERNLYQFRFTSKTLLCIEKFSISYFTSILQYCTKYHGKRFFPKANA